MGNLSFLEDDKKKGPSPPAHFVVQLWEHERGWGVRPDGKRKFPLSNEGFQEAKEYRDLVNGENTLSTGRDVYWTADNPKAVLED